MLRAKTHNPWTKGLGHIKIALTGTDISSFLDIIQGHFDHASLIKSSDEEEDVPAEENRQEEGAVEETNTGKVKKMSNLASAELGFPFKSIP